MSVAAYQEQMETIKKNRAMISKAGVINLLFAPRRLFWIILDIALILILFNISAWISPYTSSGSLREELIFVSITFSLFFVMTSLGLGYYERSTRFSYSNIFLVGLTSTIIALPFSIATSYLSYYGVFGRYTIAFGALGAYLGVSLTKAAARWSLKYFPYRFTFIGSSPALEDVRKFCSKETKDSRFYELVELPQANQKDVLSTIKYLYQNRVADIVISDEAINDPESLNLAFQSLMAGFKVVDEVSFYKQIFEKLPIDQISKEWILSQGLNPSKILSDTFKRLLDIIIASISLVLLAPLMLIIALTIKLTSKGPIFFNQTRMGFYGQQFLMFKFRTMHMPDKGGEHQGFTKQNDNRVTLIGRIIRPLHLDELPQLLNIFLGLMSIVGPRPEAIDFARRMSQEIPLYSMRYLVRPGLTGFAQIHQGYAMDTLEDTKGKLAYDLFYIVNHSILMDCRIILRTVFVLAKGAR